MIYELHSFINYIYKYPFNNSIMYSSILCRDTHFDSENLHRIHHSLDFLLTENKKQTTKHHQPTTQLLVLIL